MTPKITLGGLQLMIHAMNGGDGIQFSKVKFGNGECPENYKVLTELQNPVVALDAVIEERLPNEIVLRTEMDDSQIDSGFFLTEVGVFTTDPEGGDDILYAYGHYQITDDFAAMPIRPDDSGLMEFTDLIHVYVGDIEDITAVISDGTATVTKAQFLEHTQARNPHGMTKDDIDLGNVPNVTTDDQQPTVSLPQTLTEIANGDRLSTIVSKAALAVKSFITHLTDSVKHITAAERTAWDSKAPGLHNHDAVNINTGVLGVARGGTGKGSWTANRLAYPSSASAFSQLAFPSAAGQVLQQGTSGAPFWGYPSASESGSYTGGHTSGSANKNSIAFKKLPGIVFIRSAVAASAGAFSYGVLFVASGKGFSVYNPDTNGGVYKELIVSKAGNTVSWYFDGDSPAHQLNVMSTTYNYVGIF